MRRLSAAALALLLATGLLAVTANPAHAEPVICETFGATYIQNDTYRVQNNVWGADTAQCIDVDQSGGFTVTQAEHNNATNGAPASYPSIYAGCHYAECTAGSDLPMQASSGQFSDIRTSVSMSYPGSGTWNAAYDLWFDPTPRTDGQNTGAEMMIWLNRQGSVQPIGSPVATVNLAGAEWEVWFGNTGWNVISYLRTSPTTSVDLAVDTFYSDAVSRGYAERSWYLTSVQAGFEPWIGGAGLAVNSFSYSTEGGGTGGDTTPPSTPQGLAVTGTTAGSVSLSWNASSDNVGVTGYEVYRRQDSSGTFSQVGSPSGTSFTSTGLSADTQYEFYVVARDGAGNTSGESSTVTATTEPDDGGGNGGGVSCTISVDEWDTGYVIQVTINSGSAINGWVVGGTLPDGHELVNAWNTNFSASGQSMTFEDVGWNGDIQPGQSATFGFQGSRPAGNTELPDLDCD